MLILWENFLKKEGFITPKMVLRAQKFPKGKTPIKRDNPFRSLGRILPTPQPMISPSSPLFLPRVSYPVTLSPLANIPPSAQTCEIFRVKSFVTLLPLILLLFVAGNRLLKCSPTSAHRLFLIFRPFSWWQSETVRPQIV